MKVGNIKIWALMLCIPGVITTSGVAMYKTGAEYEHVPLAMLFDQNGDEKPTDTRTGALLDSFILLLSSKAAPILVSDWVLYNFIYRYAHNRQSIDARAKDHFKISDFTFKASDWEIYFDRKQDSQVFLLFPKTLNDYKEHFNMDELIEIETTTDDYSDKIDIFNHVKYLSTIPFRAKQLEFFLDTKQEHISSLLMNAANYMRAEKLSQSIGECKKSIALMRAADFSEDGEITSVDNQLKYAAKDKWLLKHLINMLVAVLNRSKEGRQCIWDVYIGGHGMVGTSICNLSPKVMQDVLMFFNTKVTTGVFMADSCYIGGTNLEYFKFEQDINNDTVFSTLNYLVIVKGIDETITRLEATDFNDFFNTAAQLGSTKEYSIGRLLSQFGKTNIVNIPQIILPGGIEIQTLTPDKKIEIIGNVRARAAELAGHKEFVYDQTEKRLKKELSDLAKEETDLSYTIHLRMASGDTSEAMLLQKRLKALQEKITDLKNRLDQKEKTILKKTIRTKTQEGFFDIKNKEVILVYPQRIAVDMAITSMPKKDFTAESHKVMETADIAKNVQNPYQYPQMVSMLSGDAVHSFKKIEIKKGNDASNSGVLSALIDLFLEFDSEHPRLATKTFLIQSMTGPDDMFIDESWTGDKQDHITLENVEIKVSVPPDEMYIAFKTGIEKEGKEGKTYTAWKLLLSDYPPYNFKKIIDVVAYDKAYTDKVEALDVLQRTRGTTLLTKLFQLKKSWHEKEYEEIKQQLENTLKDILGSSSEAIRQEGIKFLLKIKESLEKYKYYALLASLFQNMSIAGKCNFLDEQKDISNEGYDAIEHQLEDALKDILGNSSREVRQKGIDFLLAISGRLGDKYQALIIASFQHMLIASKCNFLNELKDMTEKWQGDLFFPYRYLAIVAANEGIKSQNRKVKEASLGLYKALVEKGRGYDAAMGRSCEEAIVAAKEGIKSQDGNVRRAALGLYKALVEKGQIAVNAAIRENLDFIRKLFTGEYEIYKDAIAAIQKDKSVGMECYKALVTRLVLDQEEYEKKFPEVKIIRFPDETKAVIGLGKEKEIQSFIAKDPDLKNKYRILKNFSQRTK